MVSSRQPGSFGTLILRGRLCHQLISVMNYEDWFWPESGGWGISIMHSTVLLETMGALLCQCFVAFHPEGALKNISYTSLEFMHKYKYIYIHITVLSESLRL